MAGTPLAAGRGRGGIVGINVTPFVDIALVLLIIMMVSSTYVVSRSLNVELPKSASSDQPVSKPKVVIIGKNGELSFNNAPIERAQLQRTLSSLRKQEDVNLVIAADEMALHGKVVEVIDVAKLAGVSKFSIQVGRGTK